MSASLAELFRRGPDLASFRRAVAALGGDFHFSSADMIDLGTAYFERFPDRVHDRNAEEVRIGYAVVRAAIIEKAVLGIPGERQAAFREMLDDVSRVGPAIEGLLGSAGPAALAADIERLSSALNALRTTIDEIPKGMVKERFVGGISNLFNILYLVRMKAKTPRPDPR
jgi:hypothetical protein